MLHPLLTCILTVTMSHGVMAGHLDIHNHGAKTAHLYPWSACSPNGTLVNDVLVVSRDGKPVRYTGVYVKYKIDPADYTAIGPGQHYTCTFAIDGVYDVAHPGLYRLHYQAYLPTPDAEKFLWQVVSPEVTMQR